MSTTSDSNFSSMSDFLPSDTLSRTFTEDFLAVTTDFLEDGQYLFSKKEALNEIAKDISFLYANIQTVDTVQACNIPFQEGMTQGYLLRLTQASSDYNVIKAEIDQITKTKASHFPTIILPIDTDEIVAINYKEMHQACCRCGNSAFPVSMFESFLSKLFAYGRRNEWPHSTYMEALPALLEGHLHTEFMGLLERDLSFKDIMDQMTGQYIATKTIQEYTKELHTFARQPNEKINTAMSRYTALINKTATLFPNADRENRKTAELTSTLLQIASPAAKQKLAALQLDQATTGRPLPYEAMLRAANISEANAMDMPTVAIPSTVVINSLTCNLADSLSFTDTETCSDLQQQQENILAQSQHLQDLCHTLTQSTPINQNTEWDSDPQQANTVVYKPFGPNIHNTKMNIYMRDPTSYQSDVNPDDPCSDSFPKN